MAFHFSSEVRRARRAAGGSPLSQALTSWRPVSWSCLASILSGGGGVCAWIRKRVGRWVGVREGCAEWNSISADAFLRVAFVCLLCSIPAKMVNCLVVRARAIVKVS